MKCALSNITAHIEYAYKLISEHNHNYSCYNCQNKATPVVINEGMWGAGTFIFNIIYGNMGYEYFSAITILRSFENIAFIIFIGICSASSVMIGKSILTLSTLLKIVAKIFVKATAIKEKQTSFKYSLPALITVI